MTDVKNNSELVTIYSKSQKYKRQFFLDILEKYNDIDTLCLLNSDTFTKNFDKNDVESFRNCYLIQTKKFFNGHSIFGLIHIRFSLFIKNPKKYDEYIQTLVKKINNTIKITNQHNNENLGRFYVFLDLENININNFSRKLFKRVSKIVEKNYDDKPINYFVSGKNQIIKIVWPIISIFLSKETKKKTIFLEY